MRGTLAISWGPWGGFYLHRSRICLGWIALTLLRRIEIDELMRAYADEPGMKHSIAYCECGNFSHDNFNFGPGKRDGYLVCAACNQEGPWRFDRAIGRKGAGPR